MDGQNYVVFHTAADDSYMNSSANFKGMDITSNTTATLYFGSAIGGNGFGYDSVLLNFTAGKEITVLEAVGAALAGAKNPVTVVADDINSIYCDPNITSCGAISLGVAKSLVKTDILTAGGAILADASGSTILLNVATADFTLPAATAGLNYKFILGIDTDASFSIGANAGDCFYGNIKAISHTDNKTAAQDVTRAAALAAPGNFDFLDFDHDVTTLGGKAGDMISITCDGGACWHVEATITMDGNPSSLAVINAG